MPGLVLDAAVTVQNTRVSTNCPGG